MQSTMQDGHLTIGEILRHATTVHRDGEVLTATDDGVRRISYGELGERTARLANALRGLGIGGDERVATFGWNNQEHLEAYLAVPAMGAVLHALNVRLPPEQIVYVANHAEDRVIIADSWWLPLLAKVLPSLQTVDCVLVVGSGDASALAGAGKTVLSYPELLAASSPSFDWPTLDERSAAAMCYTSGTTGRPKGVVYSHRSAYLHSMAICSGNSMAISARDMVLPVVPMFHVNAWGLPYAAALAGAHLLLPDRFVQAEPLARLISTYRPTVAGAVPTIWNDLLQHVREHPADLSSLRLVACGGSAVPRSLMEAFQDELGVYICHAWGMTETSPVATVARAPRGTPPEHEMDYRSTQGRVLGGVEARLVDDAGHVVPCDGKSVGEIEVRGPWVTGSYYQGDEPERFDNGWLRTGDVGTIDPLGYVTLTDRAKDVIKSGGEWISSVELETTLMGHPDVVEAAVIGVPDQRWQERPLAVVVPRPGAALEPEALREWLGQRVAHWQAPERWTFVEAVPRTSVGKFDKKVIRRQYAEGELTVTELPGPGAGSH